MMLTFEHSVMSVHGIVGTLSKQVCKAMTSMKNTKYTSQVYSK